MQFSEAISRDGQCWVSFFFGGDVHLGAALKRIDASYLHGDDQPCITSLLGNLMLTSSAM